MENTAAKDWKGVTGGHTAGQKGMILLFRLFGVNFCYAILAIVVPFYMLFAAKGRKAIYRYFRERLGYPPMKSLAQTYRNHYLFGQCMLDRFAVYAGKIGEFSLEIEGNENFLHLLNGEKGFIIASAHIGNFELSGYMLHQEKKPINAIIYGGETKEVMENRTKAITKNGVKLIPVAADMSHLFQINDALSKGEIVSMPCDRTFGSPKSVECSFMGGNAAFPVGAFTLAATFDVPVLTIVTVKKSRKGYLTYVIPVVADCPDGTPNRKKAEYLTKAFATNLEGILKQHPQQWFNFYNFWK